MGNHSSMRRAYKELSQEVEEERLVTREGRERIHLKNSRDQESARGGFVLEALHAACWDDAQEGRMQRSACKASAHAVDARWDACRGGHERARCAA